MAFRDYLFDNIVGDLEYHPKRGMLYLGLGAATLCFSIFAPFDIRFAVTPLVFGAGGLTLLLKGLFLLRKTSEGLGLSQMELDELSAPSNRKALPSIPALVGQIVQDFGAGALLLGYAFLHVGTEFDHSWSNQPKLPVILSGVALFFLGWLIRFVSSSESVQS